MLTQFFDFFLHADTHLRWLVENYGAWIYLILFIIIFCETGLVVTPFLPGDSLLFAVGALASQGIMHAPALWILLIVASVLGDFVNYSIGAWIGPKAFQFESTFFFKKESLKKAHAFYEKFGGRAIVLARFIPIIRTFAPFVAGIGTMHYKKFVAFNVLGAIAWVSLFLWAGYFFGRLPFVMNNMKIIILGIIIISVFPIVWEWWSARRSRRA